MAKLTEKREGDWNCIVPSFVPLSLFASNDYAHELFCHLPCCLLSPFAFSYSCKNLNFAWRMECNRCGAPRPLEGEGKDLRIMFFNFKDFASLTVS